MLRSALALTYAVVAIGCSDKFSASEGAAGTGTTMTGGCADGTREAYASEERIAACAGAFDVPGVVTAASQSPACARGAGNDGSNAAGTGCSVADLCGAGFHVCRDVAEVQSAASTGACPPASGTTFWLTRQATDDSGQCVAGGANNLVGCGAGLGVAAQASCAPLDTEVRYTHCQASSAWECGGSADANSEASVVTKVRSTEGGALCCKD